MSLFVLPAPILFMAVFVFGAVVGGFLNVCIVLLPNLVRAPFCGTYAGGPRITRRTVVAV